MRTFLIVLAMSLVSIVALTWTVPTRESALLEESVYIPPPELVPMRGDDLIVEEPVEEKTVEEPLPSRIVHEVAFTSQAPYAQWAEALYQDACEEASVLMAARWVRGEKDPKELAPAFATEEIARLADVSVELFDTFIDTSAEDTLWILQHELPGTRVELLESPTIEDMKRVLANDGVLIMPMDGQILVNPYFNDPGPERHMLVLIGFDDRTQEFITNDPGTRRGAGFRYGYENFFIAMRDYPTGDSLPITTIKKVAIAAYRSSSVLPITDVPANEDAQHDDGTEIL